MDHTGLNTYDTIVHSLEFFNKGSTNCNCDSKLSYFTAHFIWRSVWGLMHMGVSADSDIVYRGQLYREFREMAARLKDFGMVLLSQNFQNGQKESLLANRKSLTYTMRELQQLWEDIFMNFIFISPQFPTNYYHFLFGAEEQRSKCFRNR